MTPFDEEDIDTILTDDWEPEIPGKSPLDEGT